VIEYVFKVFRNEPEVQRHEYRAEKRRAKKSFEYTMAILRKHSYAVAFLYAERAHHISPTINSLAKLSVSQSQVAAHYGLFARVSDERALEKIVFFERNDHDYTSTDYSFELMSNRE